MLGFLFTYKILLQKSEDLVLPRVLLKEFLCIFGMVYIPNFQKAIAVEDASLTQWNPT